MNCESEAFAVNEDRTRVSFSLDKAIYSKEAILKACYWFAKDLTFQIESQDNIFEVVASVRTTVPTLEQPRIYKIDEFVPDLLNAFVDFQLRVEIHKETSTVRELIVAKAFAESGILEDLPPGAFEDSVGSQQPQSDNLVSIQAKLSQ
jgi:His-Xaa-Ser system protein HxsD